MDELQPTEALPGQPRSLVETQQQRWEAGDRVTVEQLVSEHPDVADQPDVLMDLIYGETLLREAAGEQPNEEEYVRRFPQLEQQIVRQFQIHRALDLSVGNASTADPEATLTSPPPPPPPRLPRIPGFDLQRIVGRGGNGIVYRAIEERLNRPVAVKLLLGAATSDERQRTMLFHEAEAAASLRHPGIVPVYQVGEHDGTAFLIMELRDGGSLAERLHTGPLPVTDAVKLVTQVAAAVQFAHSQGTIHRDLKPGNVLLDQHGQPQVSDFGLARRLDAQHTLHATGDVVGTPAYMSPEQARGETADERSDVYSLGAVLYEILCGRSPFQAATPWEIVNQVLTEDPPPLRELNSSVPRDLETICVKCLEKDPARRYASAQELADELIRFENGEPILARPVGQLQRLLKWCRRNRRVAALGAVSLALLLALGVGSTVAAIQFAASNRTISAQRQRASIAEQAAVQDRTAAVNALNTLVESLYEDLSANAATINTREKVVDAAIAGLTSLSQVQGDRNADRTTLRALHQIADLMSLKGLHDEAERYFHRGIDLARDMRARHPDDTDARLDLAAALGRFSMHYTRLSQAAQAKPLADESFELLSSVLTKQHDNIQALRQIVVQHQQRLESVWLSRDAQGQGTAAAAQAIAHIDQLLRLVPDDAAGLRAGQVIHFQVGRTALEAGDPVTADRHFRVARDFVDRLLADKRQDPELRTASALLDRARALVETSLGQPEHAAEHFASALQTFRELAAADPLNTQFLRQVANTQSLMAETLNALRRSDEAIRQLREAIGIYNDQLRQDSGNNTLRILTAEAWFRMSNACLAGNQWQQAEDCCGQILRYLQSDEFGEPIADNAAGGYITLAGMIRESLLRLQDKTVDAKTTTGECIALMLAARRDAQTATSDELSADTLNVVQNVNPQISATTFEQLFDHIDELEGVNPMFSGYRPIYHAATLAFRADNLAESNSPDNQQTANRHRQHAVELLQALITQTPAALQVVLSEPDLTALRNTSEWSAADFLPKQ